MPTNDFLPFGTAVGANVMTQADYLALAARSTGYTAGTAASVQVNKTWRQSSIMAATLAQFIVDQSGQNAVDDGTTATLEANLLIAIRAAGRQATILTDTGSANAYAAANTPALIALPATGYSQRVNIANANTGASTYAPDGLVAKPIYGLGLQPLQGSELPVGIAVLMYLVQAGVNGGNGAWIIIESLGGATQVAPATQSRHAIQLAQGQAMFSPVVGATRNLTANVTAAAASTFFTFDEAVLETTSGGLPGGQTYRLGAFSKLINLATIGAGGMDTGSVPANGFVAVYVIYNPTSGVSALLAANAGPSRVAEVYNAAFMPAGYTASALLSVWPTNGSGQFVVGYQDGRDIFITAVNVLSTTSVAASLTSLSIAGAVPKNAKQVQGFSSLGCTSGTGAMTVVLAGDATGQGTGRQAMGGYVTTNIGAYGQFCKLPVITQQTIYHLETLSGSPTGLLINISVSGYTI